MPTKKMIEEALDHIEGILTESSSFDELFDKYDEDSILEIIESDDSYEELKDFIENEEYDYFLNGYMKTLEKVISDYDKESFYNVIRVFLDKEDEDIEEFFNWK